METGRLFFTESGRMMLHANEEIARWRWARKVLRLPAGAAEARADVWICAAAYPGSRQPLEVRVNGRRSVRLAPQREGTGAWAWRRIALPAGALRGGDNHIELSCDAPAMNAWMLGIENSHRRPASFLSTDRGRTWRNASMGASGVLCGEYLVRLRVHGCGLRDRPAPPIEYENANHPRVRELRALVPAHIRNTRDPWKQVLALRTWVARAWTYEAFGRNYSPWDAWTVLAWTRGGWGHGRAQPIAMCVHYGMIFASLAAALGHAARGIAVTQDINGPHGHFMAEIWDRDREKWIAHDPNFDLHYEQDQPLSAIELADRARAGESKASDMRRGAGFTSDCPRLNHLLNNELARGECFANVAVWRRNDIVSDPAAAPPNHGSVIYSETDLVWYAPVGSSVAPMFPYRVSDRDYFAQPPRRSKLRAAS
jgi:hypothetical protein